MIRIILADDHALLRQGLVALLSEEDDMDIIAQAGDGKEAWKLIKTMRPHVAILDISMPGMNGIELTARIKRAELGVRVVLLTSHSDPSLVLQGEKEGATAHILKENTFEELVKGVRCAHKGCRFISSILAAKMEGIYPTGANNRPSPREQEVLAQIAKGLTDKEIARVLNVTPSTINTYKTRLREKLGLKSKAEMANFAVRMGLDK
ncbi:MAG: response regulator transcription factor [Magnetococcales bacterium]|nr:response regulator transcription factor [Magnetococcales bacterium]